MKHKKLTKEQAADLREAKKAILADPKHAIMSVLSFDKKSNDNIRFSDCPDVVDANNGLCFCILGRLAFNCTHWIWQIDVQDLKNVVLWPKEMGDAWYAVSKLPRRVDRQKARARLMAKRIDQFIKERGVRDTRASS